MKLIFLDIDGVLSGATDTCPAIISPVCVRNLNRILSAERTARIVISSAWRNYINRGWMTLEGFSVMLESHGINCLGRLHGITSQDDIPPEHLDPPYDIDWWSNRSLISRPKQISDYIATYKPDYYVVLDDLKLDVDPLHFVNTNPSTGLTKTDAMKAIGILRLPVSVAE